MKPKLKAPGTKRLYLKCNIMLSTSAFKFNLRRYNVDRVAESGELTHIQTEPNLFAQYALQCQVIKNVAGGRDFKTMAYKVGR